jgi:hypothetical protein
MGGGPGRDCYASFGAPARSLPGCPGRSTKRSREERLGVIPRPRCRDCPARVTRSAPVPAHSPGPQHRLSPGPHPIWRRGLFHPEIRSRCQARGGVAGGLQIVGHAIGVHTGSMASLTARRAHDQQRLAPSVRPPSALVACAADGAFGNERRSYELPTRAITAERTVSVTCHLSRLTNNLVETDNVCDRAQHGHAECS